jgi:hypothetical protein
VPAVLQLHSLNAAASDAASGGDFPAAAALLRQVLESQTSRLGPDHPDLASTLNNLALMLEKSGDTAEAGRCYRRALAVATLAHGPDAASVRVSRATLAAFYREYGADGNDDPTVSVGGLDDFAPRSTPASQRPAVAASVLPTADAAPARADREPVPDARATAPPATPTPNIAMRAIAARPVPPPAAAAPAPPHIPPTAARPAAMRPWRSPEALVASSKAPEVRLPIFAARRPPAPLPAPAMRPLFLPQEAPTSSWRRTAGGMMILALGIALAGIPAWWLRAARSSPGATGVVAPGVGTSGRAPADGASAAAPVTAPSSEETAVSGRDPESAEAPTTPGEPLPVAEAEAEAEAEAPVTLPGVGPDHEPAPPSDLAPASTNDDATPASAADTSPAALRVAEAGLCADLSIGQGPWHCEPTRDTVRGGSLYYYTRVASLRDELIRHRWTRDGRLVQMVVLRILANPGDGYRTFSRQSGPLLEAGTWQVALLAPDGRVLDETEFIVR